MAIHDCSAASSDSAHIAAPARLDFYHSFCRILPEHFRTPVVRITRGRLSADPKGYDSIRLRLETTIMPFLEQFLNAVKRGEVRVRRTGPHSKIYCARFLGVRITAYPSAPDVMISRIMIPLDESAARLICAIMEKRYHDIQYERCLKETLHWRTADTGPGDLKPLKRLAERLAQIY